MRLISDIESRLVAGGGFLPSDSFDSSNGTSGWSAWSWGSEFQDSSGLQSVTIGPPTIEDANMTNVWGAIGMLGAALVAASVFPIAVSAGAVIGTAVVIGAAIGLATTP